MTHLQFEANLCNALTQDWHGLGNDVDEEEEDPRPQMPTFSQLSHPCVACGNRTCRFYCPAHNRMFLCLNRGSFEEFYYGPRPRNGRNPNQ